MKIFLKPILIVVIILFINDFFLCDIYINMSKKISGGNIFIKNKIVLYIFVFLALIDVYNHLLVNDTKTLFVLILAGYLTSMATENMTIVLVIALVVSNVFKQAASYYGIEGFSNDDVPLDVPEEPEAFANDAGDEDPGDDIDLDKDDLKQGFENDQKEQLRDAEKLQKVQEKLIEGLKDMAPLVKELDGVAQKYQNTGKNSKDLEKILEAIKNKK